MSLPDTILTDWNRLEPEAAAAAILPCNGSRVWARRLSALRPFSTPETLYEASDRVWGALPPAVWQQAFDSHPRIGEHKAAAATAQSLHWSAGEQAAVQRDAQRGASRPDAGGSAALTAGNRAYEEKFGRIFIVCATGRTASEILENLRERLENDPQAELQQAAEQQRQITQLRLRKWLGFL